MESMDEEKAYNPIYTFQTTIYLLAVTSILLYSIYYFLAGLMKPFYISILIMACFGTASYLSRREKYVLAFYLGLITLFVNTFIYVNFFGIHFGVHYYLLSANVLLSLNVNTRKRITFPLSMTIVAAYLTIILIYGDGRSLYAIPERTLFVFHEVNIILTFTIMALSFFRFGMTLKNAEEELKLYHGKIRRMAHTDALTNLPNRRSVEGELELVLNEPFPDREIRNISLAVGDLDNFKRVNDEYGHKIGDEVLKEMASRFSRSIRAYDFLGRWGGEEFLFILRDSTELQACETMERIRIKTTAEPVECSGLSLHVTLTIGVAHYRPGDTKASLFERADQLLYQGKEAGKNRVMSDLL